MKPLRLASAVCVVGAFFAACGGADDTNRAARVTTPTPTPAAVAASPQGTQPARDADPEMAAARGTYFGVCVRCHQQNGEGGSVQLDEGKTIKVPSFKRGHALEHTDEELARKITNGDDAMPAFGKRLSEEQITALVRFIRHEFQAGLQTGDKKPSGAH